MNFEIKRINYANISAPEVKQSKKESLSGPTAKTKEVARWFWNHKLSLISLASSIGTLSCIVPLGAFSLLPLFPLTAVVSAVALAVLAGSLILFCCELSKEEKVRRQARLVATLLACGAGMEEAISKIIKYDGEQRKELLNVRDGQGYTPLIKAIINGNGSIINRLIDLGADLKAQDKNGWTSLHHACCRENMEEVVNKIIEREYCLLEVETSSKLTPLYTAIISGKEKIALHLIKLGANLYVKDDFGDLVIHYACEKGLAKIVLDMVTRDNNLLNIKDKEGYTPLMCAMLSGDDKTVDILIEAGADLKATDKKGYTAFHYACKEGRYSIVSKMLKKDPELVYTYIKIDKNLVSPLKYVIKDGNQALALEMIRLSLAEWTSIQPLLATATSYTEAKSIIWNHINEILVPSLTGINPLKVAILFEDIRMLRVMRTYLGDNYYTYVDNLEKIDPTFIEWSTLNVDPKHFVKGTLLNERIAASNFDLAKLKDLFNAINFENPQAPGYKNPSKLTNEGIPTNPAALKKGLKKLIKRIQNKESYMGTPPADTPELIVYYEKFEALLKNLGQLIESLEDPSERATHLIDIAIMGLHCGGKIGEAASLYRLLSGQMAEGFESQVCEALRNYRLGIIEDWAVKGKGISYEVHRFNQYMFLLGQKLHLPGADTFTNPDPFFYANLTSEMALSIFYKCYHPRTIINFTERFILDSLKETRTREACIDWVRDHVPSYWQREKYRVILDKIRKLEREGSSRKDIRAIIKREDGIIFPVADPDPKEAIELHRQRDYQNHGPKVEEWNERFYNPIFEIIGRMEETANFQEYLTSKGINTEYNLSKVEAKAAMIEYRRQDYFFNKPEEKDWKKDVYQPIFDAVDSCQANVRELLQRNGISLAQDRDFENLLEQVRGLDYLSTFFKYDENETKIIGVNRAAVRNMLEQMEVIRFN